MKSVFIVLLKNLVKVFGTTTVMFSIAIGFTFAVCNNYVDERNEKVSAEDWSLLYKQLLSDKQRLLRDFKTYIVPANGTARLKSSQVGFSTVKTFNECVIHLVERNPLYKIHLQNKNLKVAPDTNQGYKNVRIIYEKGDYVNINSFVNICIFELQV